MTPDIAGYSDRWADTWYYPRAYVDLTPLEKFAGKKPTEADKKRFESLKAKREAKKAQKKSKYNKTRKNTAYIDFHLHTEYSDGISSPEHLARVAAMQELDIIAITDHDKIEGYNRCKTEAEKWGLKVIPGVEISTDRYHILGIGINPDLERFQEFLDYSAQQQKAVTLSRIQLLQKQGVPISLEKLVKIFPDSRLGKMNLLMAMMQDQECRKYFLDRGERLTEETYKNHLKNNQGSKEVVDKNTIITPSRAIAEIHEAKGIAIIAHPFKDIKSFDELDILVEEGLDGLEVQPNFNGRNKPFEEYAQTKNLLVTYGSDWHAGIFGREMLSGRTNGKNVLYERLARALKLSD
jgi:3',5'-nucleoside bisphosphate phosphatase